MDWGVVGYREPLAPHLCATCIVGRVERLGEEQVASLGPL